METQVKTLKDYVEKVADEKVRKRIGLGAILVYISCAVTVAVGIITKNPWVLVDVAIMLPLAILVHVKKSKGCAIALAIVCLLEMIIASISRGSLSGYLPVLGSIYAVTELLKADKEFKAYAENENTPADNQL